MKPDLLYAQAAIDWSVSNLPSLEGRLSAWAGDNLSITVKEMEGQATHDIIMMIEKEPLPLSFNVEVGAYINTIRSSLDILATALAERHCVPNPDKVYFPIARDSSAFAAKTYKGKEFVQALPDAERTIIESLKPYKGGNDALWSLHQLDIKRKHHALLTVSARTARWSLRGFGVDHHFAPMGEFFLDAGNGETALGLYAKGAPQPDLNFTAAVILDEIDIATRKPVVASLRDFASLATSIIGLFDC
jgi:hypothetical protein